MELNVGETSQLQVIMDPIPTLDADKELIFTSFNPDVATVDENGVITAHKTGYAYIQITSASDCRVITYCIVYVKPWPVSITSRKAHVPIAAWPRICWVTSTAMARSIPPMPS